MRATSLRPFAYRHGYSADVQCSIQVLTDSWLLYLHNWVLLVNTGAVLFLQNHAISLFWQLVIINCQWNELNKQLTVLNLHNFFPPLVKDCTFPLLMLHMLQWASVSLFSRARPRLPKTDTPEQTQSRRSSSLHLWSFNCQLKSE